MAKGTGSSNHTSSVLISILPLIGGMILGKLFNFSEHLLCVKAGKTHFYLYKIEIILVLHNINMKW